jgi:hypothetical protein
MKRNILIIAELDGFANSVWGIKINQYLSQKGCNVDILDATYLSRLSNKKGSLGTMLPKPSFYECILYVLELFYYAFIMKFLKNYKVYFGYFFLTSMMKIRGKIIPKAIQNHFYDLIICSSQIDSYALLNVSKNGRTFFSCPTPFADELYYSRLVTRAKHEKFRDFEMQIYKRCTYLSFHWETYADYVVKHYEYDTKNIVKMNKGTEETSNQATYNPVPGIIYFGKLDGNWINLPLLAKLSKLYPIDIYGSPTPDPKYGLNYKGYTTSDILSKYQFGLITITKDKLRKEGFSAKHLDYLSHGLPVLVPEWRENARNLKGTILFNESNFLTQIKYYSQQEQWHTIHEEALKQADELRWEKTLKAFDDILGL